MISGFYLEVGENFALLGYLMCHNLEEGISLLLTHMKTIIKIIFLVHWNFTVNMFVCLFVCWFVCMFVHMYIYVCIGIGGCLCLNKIQVRSLLLDTC
jgi:hypothetical protein